MDLSAITKDTFEPFLDDMFDLRISPEELVEVSLVRVHEGPPLGPDDVDPLIFKPARQPFSLWFKGPPGNILPQDTYVFTHETLGEFAVFMVPIAGNAEHVIYEVVFN